MTYKPFENGVMGVLNINWQCKLKSPLVIRNGNISAFKQSLGGKGRGTDLDLEWQNPEEKLKPTGDSHYSQIMDFNYQFFVKDGLVHPEYCIPASSIRGTLRNAAIKRLVELKERKLFMLPNLKEEDLLTENFKEQINKAVQILKERSHYWFDILSLFGNVFDIDTDDDNSYTWAGRLQIQTTISPATEPPFSFYSDQRFQMTNGPTNTNTQVAVRNPLDRVTMGAKEGGLHTWLELPEAQIFTINMHILNPTAFDIDLLSSWQEDLNDGSVCFGALTQQGRGQVIVESELYSLYVSYVSQLFPDLNRIASADLLSNDLLFDGIWCGKTLDMQELKNFDFSKLTKIQGA